MIIKSEPPGMTKPSASEGTLTGANVPRTARIDPAHAIGESDPESRGCRSEAVQSGLEAAPSAQMRLQAEQLAAHLRRRQQELDHREAQLNSRIAKFESEARSARLWLEQRQIELAAAGEQSEKPQLDEQSERAADPGRPSGHDADAEYRRALDALERKREAVSRRAEYVDRCRESLLQLRGQLVVMQREALESRLATEELWAQLSGAALSATVTQSLGQIRAKLARQYRQDRAELAEQRKELEAIRIELTRKHDMLVQQKRQFEQSVASRQEFS
jgi:hypothetical protein